MPLRSLGYEAQQDLFYRNWRKDIDVEENEVYKKLEEKANKELEMEMDEELDKYMKDRMD